MTFLIFDAILCDTPKNSPVKKSYVEKIELLSNFNYKIFW